MNKEKYYLIGSKKVSNSRKEYRCSNCGCSIPTNSKYTRLFIGKSKDRMELFICQECLKINSKNKWKLVDILPGK